MLQVGWTEVASKCSSKIHQTWSTEFAQFLNIVLLNCAPGQCEEGEPGGAGDGRGGAPAALGPLGAEDERRRARQERRRRRWDQGRYLYDVRVRTYRSRGLISQADEVREVA